MPTARALKVAAEQPMLDCPICREHPGRQFDRDADGGHFDDCDACHGTAKVPDLASAAQEREASSGERA